MTETVLAPAALTAPVLGAALPVPEMLTSPLSLAEEELLLGMHTSPAAPWASSLFSPSIHVCCARNVRGEIPACCLRSLLTDLLPLKFSDPFLTLLLPRFLCLLQQQVPHFCFPLWKAELPFICLKRLSSQIHQVHIVPVLWDLVNDSSAFVVFTTSMML